MSAPLEDCIAAHALMLAIESQMAAGCCWHILLEDGNVDDDDVRFCIDWAEGNGERCRCPTSCRSIGGYLKAMSKTQRLKLIAGGYAKAHEEYAHKIGLR